LVDEVCNSRRDVNVALGKPSTQSSNYMSSNGSPQKASLANDGNRNGLFQYCAATVLGETQPWWAVDLGNGRQHDVMS